MHFFPELFPPSLQRTLLSRLLHEYLANPDNKTNVHLHHHVSYDLTGSAESPSLGLYNSYESSKLEPRSFFHLSPQSFLAFQPIDPAVHRPIAISQFLNSKLRWLTLGSQYDWTRKLYPADNTPQFPGSLAKLTTSFFPNLQPEAAIVNVYTPGDTLGIHRDVSEESDNGLVSVSLGCDGVFLAGLEFLDGSIKHVVVRLRSGDAVYMSGKARFAWHGIPQILSGTCPSWLKDWPASLDAGNPEANRTNDFEPWRGWMASKRVNLNIRQVRI